MKCVEPEKRIAELEAEVERLETANARTLESCVEARDENIDLKTEVERLRAALKVIEPACRTWLEALPRGVRARGDGAWMWCLSSNVRDEVVVGIGIAEAEGVLAALGGQGMSDLTGSLPPAKEKP